MKVVQINATYGKGSTGKIVAMVGEMLTKEGVENYALYAIGNTDNPNAIRYANGKDIRLQSLKSHVFGLYGFNSVKQTKEIISQLEKINPSIVHLHNLHSHNCHLGLLFNYLKTKKTKIYWTFHDCWAFTAYCPYFDIVNCDKWKTGCNRCPQRKQYSWLFDRSKKLYKDKKHLFSDLDLTVITPSQWLADLVKQSFLSEYPVLVINNGIDLSIFRPTESCFRQKHGLEDKFLLLGVAFDWGERKGLDVFATLAKRLDKRFKIVLIGTDEKTEQGLPDDILCIRRTQNQKELAEIYSAADLFVNPTREENYPTVNMESIACGTPVVTFKTGGSPEMLNEKCGTVVEKNDVEGLIREIQRIAESNPFDKADLETQAKTFDMYDRFAEYIRLYKEE